VAKSGSGQICRLDKSAGWTNPQGGFSIDGFNNEEKFQTHKGKNIQLDFSNGFSPILSVFIIFSETQQQPNNLPAGYDHNQADILASFFTRRSPAKTDK
jgi:hypothetical protein